MEDLSLPEDLVAFLRIGERLPLNPATACESGPIRLWPLDQLRLQRFPVYGGCTDSYEEDPHRGELGTYLVPGVDLVAGCEEEDDPVGRLVWLPGEGRFGVWWDGDCAIGLFGPAVTWSRIAGDPAPYLKAKWFGLYGAEAVEPTDLVPWPRYPYTLDRVSLPIPAQDCLGR